MDQLEQTFGMKIRTRIGCWNVRTMSDSGALKAIEKELKSYKMDILGISETRWNGFGEIQTQDGNFLIYSGQEDEAAPRQAGVGILMTSKARSALTTWNPISERLIMARFRTKVRQVSIIQCYAPTEGASEDEKTAFYELLETTSRKVKKQDIVIVMGDLNAKIGNDNLGIENIIGRHGLGEMNENGNRLVDFCGDKELVIGGTLFPHKKCHKVTWTSPNGTAENQIDHIAISKQWRKSLLDVRARRGADCGSDHHLVTADVRLKVASHKAQLNRTQKRLDSDRLKTKETAKEFSLKLQNSFAALEKPESVDEKWCMIKKVIIDSSEAVIGYRKKKKKPWVSDETMRKIEERKQLKEKRNQAEGEEGKRLASEAYNTKHREVKRSFRKDKRKWVEDLAKEAQDAADQNNSKELYKITRTLANKKVTTRKPIKNKNGETVVMEAEQMKVWKEFFEELLNREVEEDEQVDTRNAEQNGEQQLQEDPRISQTTPIKSEIITALKEMKNGKAPGVDNITPEMLKADIEVTATIFQDLLKDVWEKEEIPEDWKKGLLIKIPKKGDASLCSNWRGITLLSVPSKILTRIILNRIKEVVDTKLRREQAGFRRDYSCIDMINTLRIIIEQSSEYQTPLYLSFVDFEKAFDSISRESMWRALRYFGVPKKIIKIIQLIYEDYKCQIIHEGKLSEPFAIKTGVRQGCLLSPIIFLMVLDGVMRKVTRGTRGLKWGLTDRLEDIDFADDLCIMAHRKVDMEEKLKDLDKEGKKVGLKINQEKTKEMRVNGRDNQQLKLNGRVVERVEEFVYLGSTVSTTGGTDEDVAQRIRKAKGVFAQLASIWRSNQLRRNTKLRIFRTNVTSVLLYGCQTWKVTKTVSAKLQVFINRCLRRILNVRWPDTISNEELWRMAQTTPVTHIIKKRKYGWIGHTLRKASNNISRQALEWNPQGNRKRGRPRMTWRRSVEKELQEEGKSWGEAKRMAQNRVRWRAFVAALRPPRD